MRRAHGVLAVVAAGVLALGASGCVDSSKEAAETPSTAPTISNLAAQTDSTGKTVSAPGAESSGGSGGSGGESSGGADVAAGKTFFEGACQGCHSAGGTQAGVGPKLAGAGLAEARIKAQIVNGGAVMPAGLASGTDLDNVVAYVLSLQ